MSRFPWAVLLAVVFLTGCVSAAPPVRTTPAPLPAPSPPPERPEHCVSYTGAWPVDFYYDEALTLEERGDRLVLTIQQGEEAASIEISRNAQLMEGFAADFDFDGDLDALIHQMDQMATEQGNPFTAAQRLYGCGYPASWFQRRLENEDWKLTQTHCFLYRRPEAWLLEGTCTEGLQDETDQWLSEIAVSLRAGDGNAGE